jgi:hypothetical protein
LIRWRAVWRQILLDGLFAIQMPNNSPNPQLEARPSVMRRTFRLSHPPLICLFLFT